MSKAKRVVLIILLLLALTATGAQQALKIVKQGSQAYLFGFPLVLMGETFQSMTRPETGRPPANHFAHVRAFPDHNFRQVVRPNNDTLYSTAWIDLKPGPLVLSVPDMAGRYYVMPFMDAWTNVFDSVGTRTTGSGSGHYVLAGPDWRGNPPAGLKVLRSPTNMCWLIGRIQTNGKQDFEAVYRLQAGFKLTPLSRWPGGPPNQARLVGEQKAEAVTDNPSARVLAMSAGAFFNRLSLLLAAQPPAKADGPAMEILKNFGIEPGRPFDIDKLWFFKRFLLKKAVDLSRRKLLDLSSQDRASENGWAVIRKGIGVYGTDYNVRAFVALVGLGALTPAEAAYPNSAKDRDGSPLSGRHQYRIHFKAGATPPVDAFWSLTMYDNRGFLIDNPIRRYAIGDRDDLKYNSDRSLDILIQHETPSGNQTNWLPAPAGEFAVTMRLYMPKPEFLNGAWKLPFIEKTD
ncbi:MAG: DUF1254 domain-containing protein [Proteobacteria bacterium]|nr:DUF1254 domain-containing protein [Pseudomonadota bacterium]